MNKKNILQFSALISSIVAMIAMGNNALNQNNTQPYNRILAGEFLKIAALEDEKGAYTHEQYFEQKADITQNTHNPRPSKASDFKNAKRHKKKVNQMRRDLERAMVGYEMRENPTLVAKMHASYECFVRNVGVNKRLGRECDADFQKHLMVTSYAPKVAIPKRALPKTPAALDIEPEHDVFDHDTSSDNSHDLKIISHKGTNRERITLEGRNQKAVIKPAPKLYIPPAALPEIRPEINSNIRPDTHAEKNMHPTITVPHLRSPETTQPKITFPAVTAPSVKAPEITQPKITAPITQPKAVNIDQQKDYKSLPSSVQIIEEEKIKRENFDPLDYVHPRLREKELLQREDKINQSTPKKIQQSFPKGDNQNYGIQQIGNITIKKQPVFMKNNVETDDLSTQSITKNNHLLDKKHKKFDLSMLSDKKNLKKKVDIHPRFLMNEVNYDPIATASTGTAKAQSATHKFVIPFTDGGVSLSKAAIQRINVLKGTLLKENFQKVRIIGHSDKGGSAIYNDILSTKRAKVIFSQLSNTFRAKNIDDITLEGYGDRKNIAAYRPEDDRNRRVVIEIVR